ncbi:guanylate kinase [Actinomadura kijaniata]|uniref:guanylate kinase n=1 Tax=Actinomadura kijaniata TaxID=46161 RepID=UPI003F1BF6F3
MILYGPPASGKDTVTAALSELDERFVLLTKLKVGSGRGTGYRYVSPEDLQALRDAGRLVVETERYGNRYAVDRQDVEDLVEAGQVPVIHMGDTQGVRELCSAVPLAWTRVRLWAPREVTAERSRERGDTDTARRVEAWDEADADLRAAGDAVTFDLTIRTDESGPMESAKRIVRAVGF